MVPLRPRVHDDAVPRVLVLWNRPHHLSPQEAERWVRGSCAPSRRHDAVRSARLSRLEQASRRHARRLAVAARDSQIARVGARARRERAVREWLGDLRLLGMKAEVVVAADAIELEAN